ncbi:MAG: hypothetical protein DWH81_09240 [Planctomycetota bacterium]|nr:MAG: hypothetical protein DWH81_09240 [Planctomycetota bacterium]
MTTDLKNNKLSPTMQTERALVSQFAHDRLAELETQPPAPPGRPSFLEREGISKFTHARLFQPVVHVATSSAAVL